MTDQGAAGASSANDKLDQLKAEAEAEMGRSGPQELEGRAAKRPRFSEGDVARFRYSALQELSAGARGLIITCGYRRERSAAKEAIALLKPYLPAMLFLDTSAPAAADALDEKEYEGAVPAAGEKEEEEVKEGVDDAGEQAQRRPLVPVKIGCRGVVLLKLQEPTAAAADGDNSAQPDTPVDLTAAVSRLIADVEAYKVPRPKHCQRILPLDTTCSFTAEGLQAAMQRVVAAYTARVPTPSTAAEGCPAPAPLLYAIGMHTRAGMATAPATAETAGHAAAPAGDAPADASTAPAAAGGSTEAKEAAAGAAVAGTGADSAAAGTVPKGTLDRPEAIKLMAPALEAAMSAAGYGPMKVNLTQPHLSLMVEAVPVGAHGNYLAGLCLLSKEAFSAKPKLLVKSLASTVGGGHMPAPAVRSKKQEKRDKKGKKGGEGKEAEVQA